MLTIIKYDLKQRVRGEEMLLPLALTARALGPKDQTAACASALRSNSRRLGSSDRAQGFAPET